MKDVCLCIFNYQTNNKLNSKVHSIGINDGEGYYSKEGGGYLDINHEKMIFEYRELSWEEFRTMLSNSFEIFNFDQLKEPKKYTVQMDFKDGTIDFYSVNSDEIKPPSS